jgi:hypothetical protein
VGRAYRFATNGLTGGHAPSACALYNFYRRDPPVLTPALPGRRYLERIGTARPARSENCPMFDAIFVGLLVGFFALSVGLIRFCERLQRGEQR